MTNAFIPEHEIYGLLSRVGIKTPRYCFVDDDSKVADAPFASGDPVVIKGIARELWHKSDNGALAFCDFDVDAVRAMHGNTSLRVGRKFDWLGTLIAERVEAQSARNAPSEIFVSLQRDRCCGAIISFGFGGLLTEDWARELKQSLLVWPASVYTPEEAFEELSQHWLGLLELNPLVIDRAGDVAALADDPVDVLILALPAERCVQMIERLCAEGGGAAVYLNCVKAMIEFGASVGTTRHTAANAGRGIRGQAQITCAVERAPDRHQCPEEKPLAQFLDCVRFVSAWTCGPYLLWNVIRNG
jgi:ATP-grasp domain